MHVSISLLTLQCILNSRLSTVSNKILQPGENQRSVNVYLYYRNLPQADSDIFDESEYI